MSDDDAEKSTRETILRMTADVVAAYVKNNVLPASQLPDVIRSVFGSLEAFGPARTGERHTSLRPVVPIKRSVTPDYIICLEDGKKLKMLKRHLRTTYNLTPDEYRAKWGLPADYPMVAPNYAVQRSEFAKKIGLGRKAAHGGRRRAR